MKSIDYAKTEHMAAWLRHPVLGDPSFDTFEKLGGTVHTSSPPYEWAVNGSLFRDPADGAWYCFAGLYPAGYNADNGLFDFMIYCSRDEGKTWECLGEGFQRGFVEVRLLIPLIGGNIDVLYTVLLQESKVPQRIGVKRGNFRPALAGVKAMVVKI